MYSRFFGLQSNPFGMTPDPGCLFLTTQHREAFAGLTYTILNRRGFGVLTGDAGTGKTTLVAKVLASLPSDRVQSSIIFHPTLSTSDFLELVMLDFGIEDVPATKAQRLVRLQAFLLESHQQGKISTLIIDEAHKLGPRLLEEIRLFGNFDYTDQKLLQILLVGQTELDDLLTREDLRQLKQRVAVRLRIEALASSEIEKYIRYRWQKVGGQDPLPFSSNAIEVIGKASTGLPRVINALCDNALLAAFAADTKVVDVECVRNSARDLHLLPDLRGMSVRASESSAGARVAEPKQLAVVETSDTQISRTANVQVEPPVGDTKAVVAVAQPVETVVEPVVVSAATPELVGRPSPVPSPVRIPNFATINERPSLLSRWACKLGLGIL
jgi:general secretion pathway protein A